MTLSNRRDRWRASRFVAVATAVLALVACASEPITSIAEIYGYSTAGGAEVPPIVLTAGLLGSVLEDRDSGRVVWGRFLAGEQRHFKPEIQRRLALPMTGGDSLATLRDDVVAVRAMDNVRVKLGPKDLTVNAYPGLVTGILTGVASESSSATPVKRELRKQARTREAGAGDVGALLPVAFDWRRDITEATSALEAAIERAHRRKLDMGLAGDTARVDIVAHSLGTLLLRYYLRYGTQPLPADGSPPVLDWRGAEKVRRVLLLGPPNAGSLEALIILTRGGKPHRMMPKTPAGVVGSFVSMYQLIPHPDQAALVSAQDAEPIDHFDVETWDRFGWGPLGHDERAQGVRANLMPELDSAAARRAAARRYVGLCLANARQLHAALDVPSSPPAGTTLHLFASDTLATEDVAVIDPDTGAIVAIREAPGDGTVTRRSALRALRAPEQMRGRVETPIDWSSVHFIRGDHLGMLGDTTYVNNLLYLLLQAPI